MSSRWIATRRTSLDHATGVIGTMAAHGESISSAVDPNRLRSTRRRIRFLCRRIHHCRLRVGTLQMPPSTRQTVLAYDYRTTPGASSLSGMSTISKLSGIKVTSTFTPIGGMFGERVLHFMKTHTAGSISRTSMDSGAQNWMNSPPPTRPGICLSIRRATTGSSAQANPSTIFTGQPGSGIWSTTRQPMTRTGALVTAIPMDLTRSSLLGTTKNVLTVGSVRDVYHDEGGNLRWGFTSNSTVSVSAFSRCGPTDDGRIKPDIVAVGEADPAVRSYGIVTPDSAGGYTTNYSGTSFAAPSVTAGLGLCRQRRSQLFPWLDPSLDAWRSSTLKALAIHAADDMINPGPDYRTGWAVQRGLGGWTG